VSTIDDNKVDRDEPLPPESPARDQQQGSLALSVLPHDSRDGLVSTPLSATIQSLQDSGVRGQSGMAFLQVVTGQLENELAHVRAELAVARAELKDADRRYHEEHEKTAVLRVKLRNAHRARWFQAGILTLGGVVAGIAVPHLSDAKPGFAIAGSVLGAVLIVAGCLPVNADSEVD
jgi:hypothetical protein